MYQVSAFYSRPTDEASFDDHYMNVHSKIAMQLPDVVRYTLNWCEADPEGNPSDFYLIALLYWDTKEAALRALASEAGIEAERDIPTFAGAGLSVMLAQSEEKLPFSAGESAPGAEIYSLVGVYNDPADRDAFDNHYRSTHSELGTKMPDVKTFTMNWTEPGPDGSAPPYYFVAALEWDSKERLVDGMSSPQTAEAVADLENFAGAGMSMNFCKTLLMK